MLKSFVFAAVALNVQAAPECELQVGGALVDAGIAFASLGLAATPCGKDVTSINCTSLIDIGNASATLSNVFVTGAVKNCAGVSDACSAAVDAAAKDITTGFKSAQMAATSCTAGNQADCLAQASAGATALQSGSQAALTAVQACLQPETQCEGLLAITLAETATAALSLTISAKPCGQNSSALNCTLMVELGNATSTYAIAASTGAATACTGISDDCTTSVSALSASIAKGAGDASKAVTDCKAGTKATCLANIASGTAVLLSAAKNTGAAITSCKTPAVACEVPLAAVLSESGLAAIGMTLASKLCVNATAADCAVTLKLTNITATLATAAAANTITNCAGVSDACTKAITTVQTQVQAGAAAAGKSIAACAAASADCATDITSSMTQLTDVIKGAVATLQSCVPSQYFF